MTSARQNSFARYMLIAAAVVSADQVSKQFALYFLASHSQPIAPFLQFALGLNRGAAFGILHTAGGWQRYFLSGVAAAISVALIIWLWRCRHRRIGILGAGLAAVLGGAVGNLCDRIGSGAVVDFIVLHYRGWQFPAFNIADAAITIGAALIIFANYKTDTAAK